VKLIAFSKVIFGLLLFSSVGTLFAFDVDELRERAKAMRTQASLLAEQGNKEQSQHLVNESTKLLEMAERLQSKSSDRREKEVSLGIDKETLHLKEQRQDLRNKERIMREEKAFESELLKIHGAIADIERTLNKIQAQHAESGEHRPEFRALRAELRELKQNLDKCQ